MSTANLGRPRKPQRVRELAGFPGHSRPRDSGEPHPEVGSPTPPKSLRGEALEEWNRIVPQLLAMGLLTRADRAALVAYCRAWARAEAAEAVLDAQGAVYETPQGQLCRRPEVGIAAESWTRAHRFLVEFGLTPASRSKVTPSKKSEECGGVADLLTH